MISETEFIGLISDYLEHHQRIDNIEQAGLNIWDSNIVEFGFRMFDKVIDYTFDKDGSEWIYWWIIDKQTNPELKAYDENHNEIKLDTMLELWKFVRKYRT